MKSLVVVVGWWWWGGLFDYSVKPGPDFSRSLLGLVRLLIRLAKASLAKLVLRLARSRTRLVKARARSLTISGDYQQFSHS